MTNSAVSFVSPEPGDAAAALSSSCPSAVTASAASDRAEARQSLRTALTEVIAHLDTTQSQLLSDTTPISATELDAIARDVERVRRAAEVIAAAHARRVRNADGRRTNSVATALSETTGAPKPEVFTRLHAANLLDHELIGPPLREHRITAAQGRGIAEAAGKYRDVLPDSIVDEAINTQLAHAGTASGHDLSKRIDVALSEHLPDDPSDARNRTHQHKSRSARLGSKHADGMSPLRLLLTSTDRVAIEHLSARASALAAKMADEAHGSDTNPEDRPSHEQILYDLLTDAINATLDPSSRAAGPTAASDASGTGPTAEQDVIPNLDITPQPVGATPPIADIVVRLDPRDLVSGRRQVVTSTGALVSVAEALQMAKGRPYWLAAFVAGHHRLFRVEEVDPDQGAKNLRFATSLQRLVLFATYEKCMWEGCEEPASHCQIHHVKEHQDGGTTEIINLAMACPAHHARISNTPGGYRFRFRDGPPGYPPEPVWEANDSPEPLDFDNGPPPF